MTAKTSQRLADILKAAGFIALATRAEQDEFHDFFSPAPNPAMLLDQELYQLAGDPKLSERARLAAHHIRMRHHDGEFDASNEESDEWAESPEGQAVMGELVRKP